LGQAASNDFHFRPENSVAYSVALAYLPRNEGRYESLALPIELTVRMPFYEADQEGEITYAGSIHNAEILFLVHLLVEMF
jgi:hypothetical protein